MKSAEDYGFRSDRRAKFLMSWTLDGFSIFVFIEIIVDVVHLRRCSAIHIVIPVADSIQLIKQGSIGAEEAELLARGQTPMPDLRNRTVSFDWFVHSRLNFAGSVTQSTHQTVASETSDYTLRYPCHQTQWFYPLDSITTISFVETGITKLRWDWHWTKRFVIIQVANLHTKCETERHLDVSKTFMISVSFHPHQNFL